MKKHPDPNAVDFSGNSAALRITLAYVAVGCLWILGSDRLVEWLAPDRATLAVMQTVKGWLYVAGTGILLWFLVRHHAARLSASAQTLADQHRRLLRAHRALMALSGCNQALVRAEGEDDLLRRTCGSLVSSCGYRSAWVDLARDGAAVVASEPGDSGAGGSHHAAPVKNGRVSSIALPLAADGRTLGVLNIEAPEPDAFDEDEVRLLAEVATDLAFGISNLRLRRAHEASLAALEDSQQHVRTLFATMPLGIVYHDAEGRITAVNPAAEEILGLPFAQLRGRSALDCDVPGDVQPAMLALRTGEPVRGVVLRIANPLEARHRWILAAAVPQVRAGHEGPWQVYTILEDVTRRREAESQRSHLEAQLRQAQKLEAIGRLAGGVAHDFNNMLSIVMGRAELALLRLASDDPLRADVAEMRRAADRGAELTRQLLAFARQQPIAPKVLDLNAVIEQTKGMLTRLIGEDVALSFVPGPDLWPVKMDPSQLDQVLTNLAVNARDAIGGVGTVTIETANVTLDASSRARSADARPGDYVVVSVSDSGCGMDQEIQAHVFEPFFTTKTEGRGTGLGLSTVFGIVQQNEGFIELSSAPEEGTTFKIYVPRSDQTEPAATMSEARPSPLGDETIMIVEDEEQILRLCGAALEAKGYRVLMANAPEQALDLCRSLPDDLHLLITDVVMPSMNGRELEERIEALKPGMRTLFMSGYTADVIANRGVLSEGTRYIQKPFGIDELALKVRSVLDEGGEP